MLKPKMEALGPNGLLQPSLEDHLNDTERKLQRVIREADALRVKLEAERARLLNLQITSTEFVSRMNHELRTPLHVIMSYAQLLQMEPGLSDQRREDVGWIHKSGRYMLSVINDLIDLSRMEISGAQSMQLEWFLLSPVFHKTIESHLKLAASLEVELQITLAPSPHLEFYGDVVRFKQLLINLVSNAIKYTEANGLVIFRVIETANEVTIEIEDSGCGIPSDRLEEIFTPFNDVSASYPSHIRRRSTGLKSSGIGLSLAKRMAELMDMDLRVKSEEGLGSTFFVIVPPRRFSK
jgi:signal transduction histidine kinase